MENNELKQSYIDEITGIEYNLVNDEIKIEVN